MPVLWIRHGEKKFKNGRGMIGYYKHDPPLKDNFLHKINIVGHSIYLNQGLPDKIICSPFLRTRETSKRLQDFFFLNYNKFIDIEINIDIGEYLGWLKPVGLKAQVSEETSKYITPILGKEKIKDVEERCKKHVKSIDASQNLLIVTHGIVIEFLHKCITGERLPKIKELSGFCLTGETTQEFDIISKIP